MSRSHLAILATAFIIVSLTATGRIAAPQKTPPAKTQPALTQPSVQEINDAFAERITKQIAGHEQDPAEKVFSNIQIFKGVPGEKLLLIMNLGYSRALGVTCTHCHVEQDFSSDDKRPKRAAREMAAMHRSINEQLAKMKNLEPNPEGHFINCSTCHRGAIDPMAPAK